MLHLDLFSGLGGFAYATDQIWDNVEHIFCDNDPFCQEVLKKHWKGSEIYGDIRQLITDTNDRGSKKQEQQTAGHKQYSGEPPFILTGGFPCQPFSAAGVRKGTADERYLWPAMFEVIQLTKPEWVIAENVRGLLTWENGLVFEQVCSDLEAEGYEVQAFIIPAVAVNAPHRRDRVWFVANHNSRKSRPRDVTKPVQEENFECGPDNSNAENPVSQRGSGRGKDRRQILGRKTAEVQDERPSWESDWLEIATKFCSMDDGLPVELGKFKLSKARHRAEQLKAYGNAIVPQVAIEIMKGIKLADEQYQKTV